MLIDKVVILLLETVMRYRARNIRKRSRWKISKEIARLNNVSEYFPLDS